MSYPETTTMATASAFNLPTMAGLDFGNDDLADDMEGLTLSFPKVKIPSGGALQFELPTGDPENPEYTRFLQGVILYHHASGAYWPEGCEYDDSAVVRRRMSEELRQPIPVCEAVLRGETFHGYERLLRKKRHEYLIQSQPFQEMTPDTGIGKWLDDFWLWDAENEEEILLNDTQLHDLNLALQKRYTLLQWEQGSGKTLAGIAYGKYRMDRQGYRNTWVISSAISIRNNWNVVLPNYDVSYVFVERLRDLERIKPGDFVLMTFNALCKYRRQIKKWLKIHSRKTCLVLDESDEICNPYSSRAKAVLSCFRRCQSKLLTTGTSTRNNISEFAPQMELLYNNSINMLSCCHTIYHYRSSETYMLDNVLHQGFAFTPLPTASRYAMAYEGTSSLSPREFWLKLLSQKDTELLGIGCCAMICGRDCKGETI